MIQRAIETMPTHRLTTRAVTTGALCLAAMVVVSPASATGDGLGGLLPAGTTVSIGAQAIVQPKYEGGKDYEVIALPMIKFGGTSPLGSFFRVDARGLNDIGVGILNVGPFSAGPAIGYRFGRDEDDGARLRGLGDIDGGLLVGGFARYNFSQFGPGSIAYARVSYLTQVTGDDDAGGLFRLQLGADAQVTQQLVVKPFAAVEFGDDDYMSTYFGIDAAQSARSGLARFDAGAGAKSLHLGLTAEYEVFPTWTLLAGVEYVRLLGDAADSAITEEENQVIGRIGLSKTFQFGR